MFPTIMSKSGERVGRNNTFLEWNFNKHQNSPLLSLAVERNTLYFYWRVGTSIKSCFSFFVLVFALFVLIVHFGLGEGE